MAFNLSGRTDFSSQTGGGSDTKKTMGGSAVWQRIALAVVLIAILAATGLAVLHERQVARDVRRISDVKNIMAGLVLYHDDHSAYPATLKSGEPLTSPVDGTVYLVVTPSNPEPGGAPYTYATVENGSGYALTFSLEGQMDGLAAGQHQATPQGIK